MFRPYQTAALFAIHKNFGAGVRRQLIASPTGSGKTVIFSAIPLLFDARGQVLVLVHREELVQQNAEKLRHYNPTLRVEIEQAEQHASDDADIIVASVPTLGRENSERRDHFNWNRITICIVDEAHHATAESYKRILEHGGFLVLGSPKLLLGFTATPNRADGTPLADIFEKIVFDYPLRKAIEDKWLADLTGLRVDTDVSLDGVHTVAGDFAQNELADAVNNPARNKLILSAWQEHARGRRTIIFCVDIAHAQAVAEIFRQAGIHAEAVWGTDPERAAKLAGHKAGEIEVLTNCAVLTEGYDDPAISCIVLARPTKSPLLFTQMIGRGTRLAEGKENCLVLDIADNTRRHSLATLPSLFGLPAKMDLRGHSAVDAIKRLDDFLAKHPSATLPDLNSIEDLEHHFERIDLLAEKQAVQSEEIAKAAFVWTPSADGIVLFLPEKQRITIRQNLLGKWEVTGLFEMTCSTQAEAIAKAQERIEREYPKYVGLLRKDARWRKTPATAKQIETIRKLYKQDCPQNVAQLSKGEAAELIAAKVAAIKSTAATERQVAYIRKLYRGRLRTLPDLQTITGQEARGLIADEKKRRGWAA